MFTVSTDELSRYLSSYSLLGGYPFSWDNTTVWLHEKSDQFYNFGAFACNEVESFVGICRVLIECVVPLPALFVTVQPFVKMHLDFYQHPDIKFALQEIKVYGEGRSLYV